MIYLLTFCAGVLAGIILVALCGVLADTEAYDREG